jgi:metaxin
MQWGQPQNLDETRTLYAKRIPFPFNFYYPRKYVLKVNELTQTLANFSIDDPIENHDTANVSISFIKNFSELSHQLSIFQLNAKAKKCLNWISEKLATNEWQKRLEEFPSEYDATLYAYLAIISRQKLPDSQLQAHAKQCDNLLKFVEKITKKFFKPSERFETVEKKSANSEEKPKEEKKFFDGTEQDEDPKEVRNRYIFSGLVAFSVMSFYAAFIGLFKVLIKVGLFITLQFSNDPFFFSLLLPT